MRERREAPAFRVGETQSAATEVGFADAVFREEIGDDLLLVPLQPAGNHRDQKLEDHSRSSGGRHDEIVRSSVHPTRATSIR
jgi:hypothetical protein